MSYFLLPNTDDTAAQEQGSIIDRSADIKPFATKIAGPPPSPNDRQTGIKLRHAFVYIDPAVGGRPSPGTVNRNFGTGQSSANQKQNGTTSAPLTQGGARRSDPVIGNVGKTARQTRQSNGVLAQLADFNKNPLEGAAAFVGIKLQKVDPNG